jgi:hypothetical protein
MVTLEEAAKVAAHFQIPQPFEVIDFEGKGNINLDTLLVRAGDTRYLMQRINPDVFPLPDRVMSGMVQSLAAQRAAVDRGHQNADGWRVPELVESHEGTLFVDLDGTWRMMSFIEGTRSFKSLAELPEAERLRAAHEVGRGLAIYSDLTSTIDSQSVPVSLPGYRNSELYFNQLHAALMGADSFEQVADRIPTEEEVRQSTERHFYRALSPQDWEARRNDPELELFIDLALEYESLALEMQRLRETGVIRQTAIHGDTKLENFLFCQNTGRVVSLVDLDTIMPHSWLADWGDMVRSLANVAGEKETDLSKIAVDEEVYAAVLEGFLTTATSCTPEEVRLMPQAVQVIALELGVRFLADYLRGDTYFMLTPDDPRELNKVRAMVQLTLFRRLLDHEPTARELVERFA